MSTGTIATSSPFRKKLKDHFYDSAPDSATWKYNVQAQQLEQAVKRLQHNCSPRLEACVPPRKGGETVALTI